MSTSNNLLDWQNRLVEHFERATGIPWCWENERSAFEVFPRGEFSGPHAVDEVGRDYTLYEYPEPGLAFAKTVGRRTGMVLARVFSRNQTATDKAWIYLEKARMAFKHPQTLDAWNLVGMSLASTSTVRLTDAIGSNDRMESIATMELVLNLLPSALTGDDSIGTIESVGVRSSGLEPKVDETIPSKPPP